MDLHLEFPRDLYDSVGVHLQYISENKHLASGYIAPQRSGEKPVIRLVYGLKPEKAANLDALTGSLLDYNGSPLREEDVTIYHFSAEDLHFLSGG